MSTERTSNGRFAAGNRGGPGNPFARQAAALRQALLDAVTPEDMAQVAAALLAKAKAGDVRATKLLFSYLLGKPAPSPDPDHLDREEWRQFREEQGMMDQVPGMIGQPEPSLPLHIIRQMRGITTSTVAGKLSEALLNPEQDEGEVWEYQDEQGNVYTQEVPSANGVNGTSSPTERAPAPSPDGCNGAPARSPLPGGGEGPGVRGPRPQPTRRPSANGKAPPSPNGFPGDLAADPVWLNRLAALGVPSPNGKMPRSAHDE